MTDTRRTTPGEQATASERHGRDLKQVNEKLRELVASLRSSSERLATETAARATPAAGPALTPPPAAAAPVPADLEKKRLVAELALAREAVEHARAERERLRARLAEIEAENARVCDDFVEVQERSSELAQLYVALERIHGSASRADTFAALQEVVINVIGSEELAIFERRGDVLALVHSFGIDASAFREIPLGDGAIGRVGRDGTLFVAGRGETALQSERDLTACIPLRVGDGVHGAIAVFRLLGHKPGLGPSDQDVFELLATHAGLALHFRPAEGRAAAR